MTFLYRLIASFPNALNQEFAKVMHDKAFQNKIIKDAEDYRDDLSDEELLDRAFQDIYPAWMEDLEQRGDYSENSVILYRGISADSFSRINLKKLGQFWTWDIEKAANYSDTNTKKPLFIVKAKVPISAVNLRASLQKLVWPGYDFEESERELELKAGSTVTIQAITDKTGKMFLKDEKKGTI